MDDIDKLQNSLTEALGADSMAVLSSAEEDRPFLGVEALSAFAVYLLVKFAMAFVEELKERITKEVENGGKLFADTVFDKLKAIASKIKPFGDGKSGNQKEAVAAAAAAVEKAKTFSAATASCEKAVSVAKANIVAELATKGFSKEEADAKADKFIRTIMSGTAE